ncbi:hypothetical protein JOE23_000367 [Amphibacillus cookii]|nr:hypothetical protein [Amphibacillus cookii]
MVRVLQSAIDEFKELLDVQENLIEFQRILEVAGYPPHYSLNNKKIEYTSMNRNSSLTFIENFMQDYFDDKEICKIALKWSSNTFR